MFHTSEGKPYLSARAITDISWNEQTRGMYAQFVSGTLNFTKLESLFGAVMTTGKPVIANNAPNDPRRGGVPPGHPALNAFLGLPLHSNNRFVGVIGLANRPGGYSEEVITYLQPLVQACANLLAAWRSERQREEAEAALASRTIQLEAANKELEAFAYSVSHDLRAPLRGIDGWSHALVEDYGGKLDAQGREYLATVCAETQRMGRLIDDLLQLSRVTRAEMRREPVDLSALAGSILAGLRQHDRQRQVETVVAPGLTATGDPQLLRLVLENLLGNAWKFTSKRAQARIEFGRLAGPLPSAGATSIAASGDAPYNGTVFFIRDNGAGFDMAHAAKLFGAFQRLHRPSEFPGTGVGLATVQRIIHRHGGRVWAEAAQDTGATFYFTLATNESNHD
ncbi:MAG: GAF domain-containing protein [Verrucomicrobia bacterium]|nr:GAF domain-containing protein [Verrucomicrobiota bacterium]